jgi:hypothetical protein
VKGHYQTQPRMQNCNRVIVVFVECTSNGRGVLPLTTRQIPKYSQSIFDTSDITTPIPGAFFTFFWNLCSNHRWSYYFNRCLRNICKLFGCYIFFLDVFCFIFHRFIRWSSWCLIVRRCGRCLCDLERSSTSFFSWVFKNAFAVLRRPILGLQSSYLQ